MASEEPRIHNWTTARQCAGTAQLSCELTEDFQDRSEEYYVFVQSIIGTQVFNSALLRFMPLTQTFLGPPEVNVTPCLKCINVTIKLPTSHFREKGKLLSLLDIYEDLHYEITLKSQDEKHKRPPEKITAQVLSTVIEDLYPNRNYCVSVEVSATQNELSIPSAWKCVPVGTEPRPVAGAVPKPRNVRITSVNLRSTLQWDAPRFARGNISYTVRFKSINLPGNTYEPLGTKLRVPECDVSSLSAYGHYELQFLSKPPSAPQSFSPLPQEEHLIYDKLTVISEDSQNPRGPGDSRKGFVAAKCKSRPSTSEQQGQKGFQKYPSQAIEKAFK
ncbi:hypothetical protein WISP_03697 [Willisornis vidua]|uniref:Fibronectin type-III domain-containing protein n=1 Tax=Willisornis vidua TaxID=1566151 RepID=A0ABQ9DTI3_9PASS|nr:hypothetical protein WISP_03697 [Willisornis vidua]